MNPANRINVLHLENGQGNNRRNDHEKAIQRMQQRLEFNLGRLRSHEMGLSQFSFAELSTIQDEINTLKRSITLHKQAIFEFENRYRHADNENRNKNNRNEITENAVRRNNEYQKRIYKNLKEPTEQELDDLYQRELRRLRNLRQLSQENKPKNKYEGPGVNKNIPKPLINHPSSLEGSETRANDEKIKFLKDKNNEMLIELYVAEKNFEKVSHDLEYQVNLNITARMARKLVKIRKNRLVVYVNDALENNPYYIDKVTDKKVWLTKGKSNDPDAPIVDALTNLVYRLKDPSYLGFFKSKIKKLPFFK